MVNHRPVASVTAGWRFVNGAPHHASRAVQVRPADSERYASEHISLSGVASGHDS